MNIIRAIVFDMDGVLIDAKDWHYEALNRALGVFGIEISRYDHLVTFDGLPTRKKLEMLSLERGLPVELHQFINRLKQKYTVELTHQKCAPTFYHQYALAKLRTDGYKIGVCSNSVRETVRLMMEKAALAEYIDASVSNEDVEHPKPHPEIYEKAIRGLGMKPTECLVLEDNPNGIQAAKASGAHVLVVHDVTDVTYDNITSTIRNIEAGVLK